MAGTAAAWALTEVLIGPLPVGSMLLGTLLGALYLAFATAVLATVAGYTRGTVTTVFGGIAALLLLPALGVLPPVRPWLPSQLLGALAVLVEGAPPAEYGRAAGVTVAVTAALLLVAADRIERREL